MWTSSTDFNWDYFLSERHPNVLTHVGCLLVIDVTNNKSVYDALIFLRETRKFQQRVGHNRSYEIPFVLVGTKVRGTTHQKGHIIPYLEMQQNVTLPGGGWVVNTSLMDTH